PKKKTVLVVGGSLGARSINEAIEQNLEAIKSLDLQLIWQTGKLFYQQAGMRAENFRNVKVFEFIQEMNHAYAASDFIISRAGALAIAEICIVAKPVIFVPYPFAAEDHQTSNARALVTHNAAEMVKDSDAKTELIKKLEILVKDPFTQELMIKNLKARAIKNVDE